MSQSRLYEVASFDSVSIATGLRAIISRGDSPCVRVEAERSRLIDKIDIRVVDGHLYAARHANLFDVIAASGVFFPARVKRDVTLYVTVPELIGIEALSSAEVVVEYIAGTAIDVGASTGATVDIGSAKAETIRLRSTRNGELSVAGACDRLEITFSSGGRVSAIELSATDVDLHGANGAFAEVTALGSVTGSISSGVDVHLFGRPRSVDVKSSSAAHLTVN